MRFQRLMRMGVAAHVAGAAAAHPVLLRALLPGADDRRVLAQAEIVIAGEIAVLPLLADEKAPRAVLHRGAHAQGVCRPARIKGSINALLPGHTVAAL